MGISPQQLAHKVGVYITYLSRLENEHLQFFLDVVKN